MEALYRLFDSILYIGFNFVAYSSNLSNLQDGDEIVTVFLRGELT
jgi:hypothetical protein